jgi:CheY-like chemotaxis protein
MKNVLLVDDDDIFNFINKKTIQKLGLASEIHTVVNGQDAINLINEYFQKSLMIPDIILLDINMPIMDGFGFIEAFNKLSLPGIEKVKIIIVSSSDNPDDIDRAKKLGVSQFLTKPISHLQLMEALN